MVYLILYSGRFVFVVAGCLFVRWNRETPGADPLLIPYEAFYVTLTSTVLFPVYFFLPKTLLHFFYLHLLSRNKFLIT